MVQVSRMVNNSQLILTSSPGELRTDLWDVGIANVVTLLDELGTMGWQLVAIRNDEYWLTRPEPTAGEASVPRRLR